MTSEAEHSPRVHEIKHVYIVYNLQIYKCMNRLQIYIVAFLAHDWRARIILSAGFRISPKVGCADTERLRKLSAFSMSHLVLPP